MDNELRIVLTRLREIQKNYPLDGGFEKTHKRVKNLTRLLKALYNEGSDDDNLIELVNEIILYDNNDDM